MTGTIADLVAKITGNISGFRQAMSDGANATDGFAKSWTKAGSDVATMASRISIGVGTMVGAVVGYTAKMGIAFNSMKEDALADFTVMLQSAVKAKEMLADIQDFAAKTPLETSDITGAAKTLLQFGVAGDSILPTLKRLGDASGGNSERFKAMSLAFGQMSSTGHLMGQDLLQMINAGFNPLNEVAKRTGESMDTLKDRMSKGKVSTAEVTQAFIDATSEGGMFFNLMDIKSRTMTGLWSTMVDNMKINAGKIFEPFSGGLKRMMDDVGGSLDGGAATTIVFRLQQAVEGIVVELEKLASQNGAGIINNLADGFVWLAESTAKFTKYLAEQGPALMQTASGWMAMLKPIMQFLADHPQVMAALIALKVGGMLGVNQAAISLAGALIQTVTSISAMATSAGVTSTALALMPMAVTAAAIVAVASAAYLATTAMSGWGEETRKAAEEMKAATEEAKKLDTLRSDRQMDEKRQRREDVDRESDPEQKKMILRGQLAKAEQEAQGKGSSAKGAAKNADELESQWGGSLSKVAQVAREEAKTAAQEALDAAREVDRIKREIQRLDRDAAAQQLSAANAAKKTDGQVVPVTAGSVSVSVSPKEQAAADKQAMKDEAKKQDTADDKVAQFQEKLRDLQGSIPNDQLQQFADLFGQLRKEFLDGQIDADQYRDSLKFLDNRMRDASQIGTQSKGLSDQTQSGAERLDTYSFGSGSRDGVSAGVLAGANSKYDAIEQAGAELANSFKSGQISATMYAQEIGRLKKATDDVTEAAIKEEQQKRREALMKGDFKGAGLDFSQSVQKKMEERMADQQMRIFDNAVNGVVNQFFPLEDVLQNVNDGFSTLDKGLSSAAQNLGGMGKGGGNDSQAAEYYANWMNSIAGQIANMQNEISFHQQALTVLTDPTKRQEEINAIVNLTNQISKLNSNVSTFSGYKSNDPIFKDPGITGGGSHSSVTINQHIPNVQNFSQSDVDHLANSVANALNRQGHRAFA